jgi:hypothetical protein
VSLSAAGLACRVLLDRLTRECVGGGVGEHSRQHDASGDQPAIDAVKLAQSRVARVCGVGAHLNSPAVVEQANPIHPGTEIGNHKHREHQPRHESTAECQHASRAASDIAAQLR